MKWTDPWRLATCRFQRKPSGRYSRNEERDWGIAQSLKSFVPFCYDFFEVHFQRFVLPSLSDDDSRRNVLQPTPPASALKKDGRADHSGNPVVRRQTGVDCAINTAWLRRTYAGGRFHFPYGLPERVFRIRGRDRYHCEPHRGKSISVAGGCGNAFHAGAYRRTTQICH